MNSQYLLIKSLKSSLFYYSKLLEPTLKFLETILTIYKIVGLKTEFITNSTIKFIPIIVRNKKVIAVMGMMQDKDIDKVLMHLLPYFEKVNTVPVSNPRAISADELCSKIMRLNTEAALFNDSVSALHNVLSQADENTAIIVCGSLYLCSDVYNKLSEILKR